jgi:hypothetical protein
MKNFAILYVFSFIYVGYSAYLTEEELDSITLKNANYRDVLVRLLNFYNLDIFGKPNFAKPGGVTTDVLPECNEKPFVNCFTDLGLYSYCGCLFHDASAKLKFVPDPPQPYECSAQTCVLDSTIVKDKITESTITVTSGLKILQNVFANAILPDVSYVSKVTAKETTTFKQTLTYKKGDQCIVLGGKFVWEIQADMEKLCYLTPLSDCYSTTSKPDNCCGKSCTCRKKLIFEIPIENSSTTNCYADNFGSMLSRLTEPVEQLFINTVNNPEKMLPLENSNARCFE